MTTIDKLLPRPIHGQVRTLPRLCAAVPSAAIPGTAVIPAKAGILL